MEGLTIEEILTKEYEEEISYDILSHAITGWIEVHSKKIPVISNKLIAKDFIGTTMVRIGIKRYSYKIPTGLYAVGKVSEKSPVLVTSNYKLSFDSLRKELDDEGYWILVLDTSGINVWCAAGKGTFSTRELIYQIHKWELDKIVKSNKIILPQLGASSMEAYLLRKYTKFSIIYGPVRSKDVMNFIENHYQASEAMRRVSFNTTERLILTPIEFVLNTKYVIFAFLFFLILNILKGTDNSIQTSIFNTLPLVVANILVSIAFPLLIPILPFTSFALNGALIGIILAGFIDYNFKFFLYPLNLSCKSGIFILLVVFVSYTAFNFTGSTTFTSFSGVKKEARTLVPLILIFLVIGLVLYFIGIIV